MSGYNNKTRFILQIGQGVASLVDGLILFIIYLSFPIPIFFQFMLQIGRFIFMPISIFMQLTRVILFWIECAYEKFPTKMVIAAVSDSLVTLLFAIAVIGNIVASAIFSVISPIIFSATCFANTLFHLSVSLYHAYQATNAALPAKKIEHNASAYEHGVTTAVGATATIAITGVMIFGSIYFAPLGMMVGIFVVFMSAKQLIANFSKEMVKSDSGVGKPSLLSTKCMLKSLEKNNKYQLASKAVNESQFIDQSSKKVLVHYKSAITPKTSVANCLLKIQ